MDDNWPSASVLPCQSGVLWHWSFLFSPQFDSGHSALSPLSTEQLYTAGHSSSCRAEEQPNLPSWLCPARAWAEPYSCSVLSGLRPEWPESNWGEKRNDQYHNSPGHDSREAALPQPGLTQRLINKLHRTFLNTREREIRKNKWRVYLLWNMFIRRRRYIGIRGSRLQDSNVSDSNSPPSQPSFFIP